MNRARLLTVSLGVLLAGCAVVQKPKTITSPPAPVRTAQNVEDAKKVAGAITDSARKAHQQGLVPQSTASGTLVDLAVTNETYVGSPDKRVDPEDAKAISALIGAMQRQETQYRADRAAWEQKIDALSRERDQYRTEVSVLGGAVAKLKLYLFWGAVLLAGVCILCPSVLWFVIRFVAGRMRAHMTGVVRGFEELRKEDAVAASKAENYLSKKMDQSTKDLVLDIKDEIFSRRRRDAA